MGLHKTSDEKLMLINEFFDSHLSIRQFCSKKGIPSSTFSTWIRLYNASINSQKNNDNNISVLTHKWVDRHNTLIRWLNTKLGG